MKNIRIGCLTVVGVLGLGILSCGSALAGEAKIMGLNGEAFMANKDGIYRVKPGMSCEAGDMLMTREGCHLDLVIGGQAGCRMLPNTTVAIASTRSEGMKLLVAEGNVVMNIKHLTGGSEFTIDTPTAVAAVRGTQFWGRVAGNETQTLTTFAVKEGSVRVTAKESGRTVDLTVGQAADLGSGPGEMLSRPATEQEMAAMKIADEIAGHMGSI